MYLVSILIWIWIEALQIWIKGYVSIVDTRPCVSTNINTNMYIYYYCIYHLLIFLGLQAVLGHWYAKWLSNGLQIYIVYMYLLHPFVTHYNTKLTLFLPSMPTLQENCKTTMYTIVEYFRDLSWPVYFNIWSPICLFTGTSEGPLYSFHHLFTYSTEPSSFHLLFTP